jgi:hypothetical protein
MLQAKEDALQRELYTTRLALIQQVCHHCSHTNAERPDDVVSGITTITVVFKPLLRVTFSLDIFILRASNRNGYWKHKNNVSGE